MIFKKFLGCKNCRLWEVRRQQVWGRGFLNAKLLFIGEAPGKTEDLLGTAFIGKSGKFLDVMMDDSWKETGIKEPVPKFYVTNVLACHPCEELAGQNREPYPDEVLACTPRLLYTYNIMSPITVVFVGSVSERYHRKTFPDAYKIYHPRYYLSGGGRNHPEYMKVKRQLSEILLIHYRSMQNETIKRTRIG